MIFQRTFPPTSCEDISVAFYPHWGRGEGKRGKRVFMKMTLGLSLPFTTLLVC